MSFFFFATFSSLVYNTTRVFWGWVHVTMFWVCSFPSSDLWVLCRAGASPAAVGACLHWVNLHMLMTVLDRFPEQAHQREKDTADGWKHVSPKRAGSVFIWFISGCQRDMMECCWGGGRSEVMWSAIRNSSPSQQEVFLLWVVVFSLTCSFTNLQFLMQLIIISAPLCSAAQHGRRGSVRCRLQERHESKTRSFLIDCEIWIR